MQELLATPDNPVPDGARVEPVTTDDGVVLRAAFWPATGKTNRGTVFVLQGRAEFIEKYFEIVGELRTRGFAVAAFDWRGQGGSDRSLRDPRRGHVRDFRDFRRDFAAVRAWLPGPGPVHVLAHSMGGCIALAGAGEGWLDADRLIALTPMVGLSLVRRPRLVRGLAGLLTRLGLSELLVPGGIVSSISTLPFDGNRLSGDRVRYDRNAAVAIALGGRAIGSPTVGWVAAAYQAMRRLEDPRLAAAISVPTLFVASAEDPICSTPAIRDFAARVPTSRLVVVPDARHEILHEPDAVRALFWEAFDAFVAAPVDRDAKAPEFAAVSP